MNEKLESKNDNMVKNLIGVLLIVPIYVVVVLTTYFLSFMDLNIQTIIPWVMYLPIIIGIFLSYKKYKEKASKIIGGFILGFIVLALYFYYKTYFVELPGWGNLGYFIYWLGITAICRILTFVFYGRIAGKKKIITFLGIYMIFAVLYFILK